MIIILYNPKHDIDSTPTHTPMFFLTPYMQKCYVGTNYKEAWSLLIDTINQSATSVYIIYALFFRIGVSSTISRRTKVEIQ